MNKVVKEVITMPFEAEPRYDYILDTLNHCFEKALRDSGAKLGGDFYYEWFPRGKVIDQE